MDQDLANDVEEIVDAIREIFSAFGDFEKLYEEGKNCCAAILARREDVMKNCDESQKLIAWQTSKESQSVLSQPLDAKSEEMQRSVGSLALSLHRQMEIIRDRLTLQENLTTANGGATLAAESLESYNRIKMFDDVTERYERRVDELSASLKARSTAGSRSTSLTRRVGGSNQLSSQNKTRVGSLQSFISMGPSAFASLATPPVSSFSFVGVTRGVRADSDVVSQEKASSRRLPVTSSAVSSVTPIFSPLQKTKPRQKWDETSSVDQARAKNLSFNSPHRLKETTVDDAACGALSKFGTTPEKLRGYSQAQRDPPQHSGMSKSPSAASLAFAGQERRTQTEINSSSAAAQGAKSSTSPPRTSRSSNNDPTSQAKSSLAKPPPVPSGGALSSGTSSSGTKSENEVSTSSFAPSGLGGSTSGKVEGKSAASPFGSGAEGGLGGMSLLGNASLFAPASAPEKADGKDDSTKSPDYHKILTEFYKEHEPKNVYRVGELLEKYKNDLPGMFAKLAKKYNTKNPLESFGNQPTSSLSSSTPGSGTPFGNQRPPLGPSSFPSTSASSSSPFTKMSTPNTTTTLAPAFGSPAPSPSLFRNSLPAPIGGAPSFDGGSTFGALGGNAPTVAFGTGIAAPAPSPFGSPVAAPPPNAFGSAAGPAPTPFGSQAPGSAPFGSPPTPTPSGPPERGPRYPGNNAREVLQAFYQEKNPQKFSDIDKLLTKYQGNDEALFRNLAKKYNIDPTRFGLSAAAPPAPTFGSSFGQASPLGGGPSPFGGNTASVATPSTSAGGGFAQFAGSTPSFGGGGFGSLAQPSGGGFGGFSAAPSTPFGAPRR